MASILPPHGFRVDFRYIPGGHILSKFDIWLSIVSSIGWLAFGVWDTEIDGQIIFPEHASVETTLISAVTRPRYKLSTVIWTLAFAFKIYNNRQQYSSVLFTTTQDEGAVVHTLGFLRMKSLITSISSAARNLSSTPPSTNETLSVSPLPSPQLNNLAKLPVNETKDMISISSTLSHLATESDILQDRSKFTLELDYRAGGRKVGEKGFFAGIIELLMVAAVHDQKYEASGPVSTYNEEENYTITVKPTSPAARDNLPWQTFIDVVAAIPWVMYQQQRGGLWSELEGRARIHGAFIAKISVEEGDHRDTGGITCLSRA